MAETTRSYAAEFDHEVLPPEEVNLLSKRIHGDDPVDAKAALQELARHNFRLVSKPAAGFDCNMSPSTRTNVDLEDLRQQGYVGILHAAQTFNPDKKCTFSTHAMPWIRREMVDYLHRQGSTVRFSIGLPEARNWIYRAQKHLAEWGLKNLSDEDVAWLANRKRGAKKTVITASHVRELREYDRMGVHSYDATEQPLVSNPSPGPEQAVIANEMRQLLLSKLAELDKKQLRALILQFGLDGKAPLTLTQVSRELKCAKATTQLLIERALRALRISLGDEFNDFDPADLGSASTVA